MHLGHVAAEPVGFTCQSGSIMMYSSNRNGWCAACCQGYGLTAPTGMAWISDTSPVVYCYS